MPNVRYASSAQFIEYAAARGVLVDEDQALTLLTRAQDYIDTTYDYLGVAVNNDSEFPRTGLEDYADDVVPYPVTLSTMYAALMLAQDVEFLEGKLATAQTKSVTIAANRISEEYATNYKDGAVQKAIRLDAVTTILTRAGLLDPDAGVMNLIGVRG